MTCAPTATRTRDLPLRRSFHAAGRPAHAQVGGCPGYLWVTADDRSFPPVLARMWHGRGRSQRRPHGHDGSGGRGQEATSLDSRLVAATVALAQCLPGRQLLRAHPLAVVQLVHVAGEHRVSARPQELHHQDLPPRERRERVERALEADSGDLIDPHVHYPARRAVAEFDVPPPPVGRSAEYRRPTGEVRRPPADAEDEDEQSRPRQFCDQALKIAGRLTDICDLAHLALLTESATSVLGEHDPLQYRYPTSCNMTSLEGFECGDADQHVRRSDHVVPCPSVTVNPFGSPSDWARNGHATVRSIARRE